MKNQAILLTAPGAAAIAVVRLCGDVEAFLRTHFNRPTAVGRLSHGELRDGERVIDDPVVARVAEDVADVSLHGGAWVIHTFLDLARRGGFEVIDRPGLPLPGEAVEDEIARYLPMARTELALKVLLSYRKAPTGVADALSGVSSGMGSASATENASATSLAGSKPPLYWLLYPPRVAIVGTANVGKSTLANQLFARDRVITADVPGTTRDWVGEIADVNGLAVMLVDTPGVRQSTDELEQRAIALSRPVVEGADLVVLVLDPTQPLEPDQAELQRRFPQALVVINKADRGDLAIDGAVRTVATTGQGIDELRRRIAAYFGCDLQV